MKMNEQTLLPLGFSLHRLRRVYLNCLNLGDQNAIELFNSPSRILSLEVVELNRNNLTVLFLKALMRMFMDYEIELEQSQQDDSEFTSSDQPSKIRLPTLSSSPAVGGLVAGSEAT